MNLFSQKCLLPKGKTGFTLQNSWLKQSYPVDKNLRYINEQKQGEVIIEFDEQKGLTGYVNGSLREKECVPVNEFNMELVKRHKKVICVLDMFNKNVEEKKRNGFHFFPMVFLKEGSTYFSEPDNKTAINKLNLWKMYRTFLIEQDITEDSIQHFYDTIISLPTLQTHQTTSSNNNNMSFVDDKKTKRTVEDVVYNTFILVECENEYNNLKIQGENYKYGKNNFVNETKIQQTCTLISMFIGSNIRTNLFCTMTKEKDVVKKEKCASYEIKNHTARSIINSFKEYDFYIKNKNIEQRNVVKFSEILSYFSDPCNRSRIIKEMILGSRVHLLDKQKSRFNYSFLIQCLESRNIVVNIDSDSFKLLFNIEEWWNKHDYFKPISKQWLMNYYVLCGTKYLSNVNISNVKDIEPFEKLLYNIVRPMTVKNVTGEKPNQDFETTGNILIEKCIDEINLYFRKTDNHFDRKKNFYLKLQNVEELIEYRNRISKKPALCADFIGEFLFDDVKRRIFEKFFVEIS